MNMKSIAITCRILHTKR